MKETDLDDKQLRIYRSMKQEVEAKFKHINTGSYQTRARYEESVKLFARIMIVAFRKQNLNRVKTKHIQYFTDYMKSIGSKNASITTNLSGVRFFFDQTSKGKQYIPTNKELGVKPRSKAERINVNRAMPKEQYEELREIAKSIGRTDFDLMLQLGYVLGERVHEIVGIRKSKIRDAKRRENSSLNGIGSLEVKGKTGLIRFIDIDTDEKRQVLDDVLKYGKGKDDRLFVDKKAMHLVIKDFQRFVRDNRDPNGEYPVTPHSLRHSFCQNEFERHGNRMRIAKDTGHGRESIADVYLESVFDWNEI